MGGADQENAGMGGADQENAGMGGADQEHARVPRRTMLSGGESGTSCGSFAGNWARRNSGPAPVTDGPPARRRVALA